MYSIFGHSQGPKLTFFGRRQVATEIFFQSPYGKMRSPKSRKKSVNKIFPSQRNTNQNFWLPDGKFWSPIFLLRIRTKRIYTPTTEKPRSFIRLLNVSSQLYTFSCLYLLEKKCTRLKNCRLVLCSMFKTVNDLSFRVLSRRSTDRHVVRTRPQPCSISRSKNMAAKLRAHCSSCEAL